MVDFDRRNDLVSFISSSGAWVELISGKLNKLESSREKGIARRMNMGSNALGNTVKLCVGGVLGQIPVNVIPEHPAIHRRRLMTIVTGSGDMVDGK